jgi:hypothetical protein
MYGVAYKKALKIHIAFRGQKDIKAYCRAIMALASR